MPSLLTHHLFGQKVLRLYGRAFEENINQSLQEHNPAGRIYHRLSGAGPFFLLFYRA